MSKQLSILKIVITGILSALLTFQIPYKAIAQKNARFSLLPSKQTGIHFNNKLTDEKDHNILIYSNYYGGAGVGIGDFNNDGLADIFFGGNLVSDALYLNKGDFRFTDITGDAGILADGGWTSGILIADVNHDGWEDIYVCRELYDESPERRKNKLYINNGDLTFTELADQYGLGNTERTRHATFLDYDRDGDLDLFLLNQPPNPGNYSPLKGSHLKLAQYSPRLFRNNGPSFTDVTRQAGLLKTGFPNSVIAADLDRDGWTDLFVANDYDAPDFFYHNNGDGTFTNILEEALRHISLYSMGVDAADINNDGWLDVMTLDMVAEDNYRLKANMSGMDPGAFWKVYNEGGHYQYMFNNLHLNHGNNLFSDVAQLAGVSSTDWSWSNLFADFDNDGFKDLYVTNGLLRDIRNTDGEKEFTRYVVSSLNEYIRLHPNDPEADLWQIINLEEALHLLPSEKLSNYLYHNNGNLTFSKATEEWGLKQKSFSNGSAYADLDNDGDLDLVVNNINDKAFIYQNNSDQIASSNFLRIKLSDPFNKTVLGSKLTIKYKNAIQFFELANVRGMYSTSEQLAHFGVGSLQIIDSLIIQWPDGALSKLDNIRTNQTLEIEKPLQESTGFSLTSVPENRLFSDMKEDTLLRFRHLENNFNDYRYQVLLPHKLSQFGPAMAVGDANNDGRSDVFMGGAAGVRAQLFLQNEEGRFDASDVAPWFRHQSHEDIDATFLDIDNDDDLDLIVVSGGNEFTAGDQNYQDRVYVNDGDGQFRFDESRLPPYFSSGAKVIPGDFDKDGWVDLFIAGRLVPRDYPAPASSKLLKNEGGRFIDITDVSAPELNAVGLVTDAVWSDYDQNGTRDLIICGEWMPITVFSNLGGTFKIIDQKELKKHVGWWFAIEKADMDDDGDDDYIVGNLGLNYKYQASMDEPFEVYYDDFDNNSQKDIVLSYYNFGKRYPVRGRSCSVQQVQMLKTKFDHYNLFASSTLEEIYDPQPLRKSLHYSATYFASAYLENKGAGNFEFHSLPNEAQLSNVNAILIEDFNGDQEKDILIAGNLYVSEIETTRNDAGVGLLLTGNGRGSFNVSKPIESGLFLPYDVKKIAIINIRGQRVLITANNNDHAQLIKWEKHPPIK